MEGEKITGSEGKICLNVTSIETKIQTRKIISKYDEQNQIWNLNDDFELIPIINGEISFISYLQKIKDLETIVKRNYSENITGEIKFYTEDYIYIITADNRAITYSKQNITKNKILLYKRDIMISLATCVCTVVLSRIMHSFCD